MRQVESPFLDTEIAAGRTEDEWGPPAAIAAESPFREESFAGEQADDDRYVADEEALLDAEEGLDDEEDPVVDAAGLEHDVPSLGSVARDHSLQAIAAGTEGKLPADILEAILTRGESDAYDLANRAFWNNHPDLRGQKLDRDDRKQAALRQEWSTILSRHVRPIIWLRGLIDELDKHRGTIPRDFLLGWIAVESDGRVSTATTLSGGELGYFQIMREEAKGQLGLTGARFTRLSTDRAFSIEQGVKLAEKYRQHFLSKSSTIADGSELLWRLTKARHGWPAALDAKVNALVRAGTAVTWAAAASVLPANVKANVDRAIDASARLKPLADLVPVPVAPTPELYAESSPWSAEDEDERETEERHLDEGAGAAADALDHEQEQDLLSDEVATMLPRRASPDGLAEELTEDETPPLPKGVHPFEHWMTPMKPDPATQSWRREGGQRRLEPLDPGFLDAGGELTLGGLQTALKDHLARDTEYTRHLNAGRLSLALVDLTGPKLLTPEYAGSRSTVAVDSASCLKVAPIYAAFQLRNDLKGVAAALGIAKTADLVKVMTERWKKQGIAGAPKLDRFLYHLTNPPDLEFTAEIDWAVDNIIDRHNANQAAKVLIDVIGYPYIASLLWQSGLRHPRRGGMWLSVSYLGGAAWSGAPKPPPAPVHGRNGTALSLATFFTLLAQDRLAPSGLPRTIKTALSTASWFRPVLPSARIASKVGLYLKCTSWGPKTENGQPVMRNGVVVQECKTSIATHVHEAGLIENGRFRYAVAFLTVGIPTGVSLLQRLVKDMDDLVRANNP